MESVMTETTTNDDWLSGLREGRRETTAALQARIRRGLGAALAGRSDVDDADLDDFTQDALLRVLQRLDTFRGDSSFTTWAMAVAIRVSLTALRKRRWATKPLDELLDGLEGAGSAPDAVDAAGTRGELLSVLRKVITEELTPRQRQVLLGELEGIPQVVLADLLSAKPGAIYKVSHDARKKLKVALERAGYDARSVNEALAK